MPSEQKFDYRQADSLVPYVRNSRTHSDAQVAQIAGSIEEFGMVGAIVVRDGVIAKGHGTLAAIQKLYEAGKRIYPAPGRKQGAEPLPAGTVPVLDVSGWTDAQFKAYVIADNKLAENAGWDFELLAVELDDLRDEGFDLNLLGFEAQELNDLIGTPNTGPEPGLTPDDQVPEAPEAPASLLGDVWVLGDHRLMCGDSTSAEAFAKLMAGGRGDMIFTDPPYGMSYEGGRSKKQFGMIANDDAQGADLIALVRGALGSAKAACKAGASAYVCFPWRTYAEFEAAMRATGFDINACIVWDKKSIGLGHQDYRPQHEFIFYSKGGQFYGDRSESDVWYMSRGNTAAYVHPTQKPVELIERALQNSSKEGDVVIDCFGGSGSTLIASQKLGRAARLMELDPRYCDVIIKRWQEFTGEAATLEVDGRTFEEVAEERLATA
jgi:DNA modification methylase